MSRGLGDVYKRQIYNHVETMEYAQAHWLAGGMVLFSFIVLLALYSGRSSGRSSTRVWQ